MIRSRICSLWFIGRSGCCCFEKGYIGLNQQLVRWWRAWDLCGHPVSCAGIQRLLLVYVTSVTMKVCDHQNDCMKVDIMIRARNKMRQEQEML